MAGIGRVLSSLFVLINASFKPPLFVQLLLQKVGI
jgi:hypothetical protein